jgi:hypothetical protein
MNREQIRWTLTVAMFIAAPGLYFMLLIGGIIPPLGMVVMGLKIAMEGGGSGLLLAPFFLGEAYLWALLFHWMSGKASEAICELSPAPRTILALVFTGFILSLAFVPFCFGGSAGGGGNGAASFVELLGNWLGGTKPQVRL